MRLDATLSDIQGEQLEDLASELSMPKSQVVGEAIALLKTAVMEIKRGRKVAIIDSASDHPVTTLTSPAFSQLEWARERLQVSAAEMKHMAELNERAPAPSASLRRAMVAHKKK